MEYKRFMCIKHTDHNIHWLAFCTKILEVIIIVIMCICVPVCMCMCVCNADEIKSFVWVIMNYVLRKNQTVKWWMLLLHQLNRIYVFVRLKSFWFRFHQLFFFLLQPTQTHMWHFSKNHNKTLRCFLWWLKLTEKSNQDYFPLRSHPLWDLVVGVSFLSMGENTQLDVNGQQDVA